MPPPIPDRYAELKSLCTARRERGLAALWEKLLLDREKETAVVKKLGSDVCLFYLILSFPLVAWGVSVD